MSLFSEVQNECHRAKMKVLAGLVPSGRSRGAHMPSLFQPLKVSSTGLCRSILVSGVTSPPSQLLPPFYKDPYVYTGPPYNLAYSPHPKILILILSTKSFF